MEMTVGKIKMPENDKKERKNDVCCHCKEGTDSIKHITEEYTYLFHAHITVLLMNVNVYFIVSFREKHKVSILIREKLYKYY